MSSLPTKDPGFAREPASSQEQSVDDNRTFVTLFSHSGALWLTGIARRAIEGAKARLRALGIEPEDPSSDDQDPNFKLT
jgi:hypothetical protein